MIHELNKDSRLDFIKDLTCIREKIEIKDDIKADIIGK